MSTTNGESLMVQGRLVWCSGPSIFEGAPKTDYNSGAPILDTMGKPVMEYGFGLAVQKGTENFNAVWRAMHKQAYTLYPDGNIAPEFAMKFKDGDGISPKGKPYADKEGYAGHIVLACTTRLTINGFIHDGQQNVQVNTGIKVGDYVNVQLNIKAHPAKGNGKPGLYLNPSAVQLIQAGKAIVNAPSGDQLFSNAAPAYAGQIVADTAPAMPAMPMQGQAPAMPVQAPAMPAQAPVAPQMPAQPHYGVLPENMQGQAPVAPQMPMQAQAPAMGNAPAAPAMPPMGQPAVTPQTGYAAPAPSFNGMPTPPMPGQ